MKTKKSPPRHAVDISEEAGVRYLHTKAHTYYGEMRGQIYPAVTPNIGAVNAKK